MDLKTLNVTIDKNHQRVKYLQKANKKSERITERLSQKLVSLGAGDVLKELIAEEDAKSVSDSEDDRPQDHYRNDVAAYDLDDPAPHSFHNQHRTAGSNSQRIPQDGQPPA